MRKSSLIPAVAALACLLFPRRGEGERLDAVSMASIRVNIVSITSSTAVAQFTRDAYNYGTRTFCYDLAPDSATHNCVSHLANGFAGSFNLSGLLPDTVYNYKLTAHDEVHQEYGALGNFRTLPEPTSARPAPRPLASSPQAKHSYDLRGRRLPPGSPARGLRILPLLQ